MNEHLSDAVSDLFPYDLPDWVVMRTHRNNYGFEAAHLRVLFATKDFYLYYSIFPIGGLTVSHFHIETGCDNLLSRA